MKKINVTKEFYYDNDGKPMHGSEKLAQMLADVTNKAQKHLNKMNKEEFYLLVKPCFLECGVEFIE